MFNSKFKFNSTGNPVDIKNYKKVVILNRKSKLEYFEKVCKAYKTSKPFWNTCKP